MPILPKKPFVLLALLVIFGGSSTAFALKYRYIEFEILTLPIWRSHGAEEDTVGYYPGGGLWPEGCLPEKGAEYVTAAEEEFRKSLLERKYPTQKEIEETEQIEADRQLKLTYPIQPVDVDLLDLPADEIKTVTAELPAEVMQQILADKPTEMLMDPQNYLHGQRVNDILRFLEIQSERAQFDICTVVLSENQSLPDSINLQEIHQRWFEESSAALMIYYVNAPRKTRVIIGDQISKGEVERILKHTVVAAFDKISPEDQLEALTIELSIQLYGVQLELERQKAAELARLTKELELKALMKQQQKVAAGSAENQQLQQDTLPAAEVAEEPQQIRETSNSLLFRFTLVGLAMIGWTVYFLAKSRAMRRPIVFPDRPSHPRLGGEYSGGTFHGISFSSID